MCILWSLLMLSAVSWCVKTLLCYQTRFFPTSLEISLLTCCRLWASDHLWTSPVLIRIAAEQQTSLHRSIGVCQSPRFGHRSATGNILGGVCFSCFVWWKYLLKHSKRGKRSALANSKATILKQTVASKRATRKLPFHAPFQRQNATAEVAVSGPAGAVLPLPM